MVRTPSYSQVHLSRAMEPDKEDLERSDAGLEGVTQGGPGEIPIVDAGSEVQDQPRSSEENIEEQLDDERREERGEGYEGKENSDRTNETDETRRNAPDGEGWDQAQGSSRRPFGFDMTHQSLGIFRFCFYSYSRATHANQSPSPKESLRVHVLFH